MIFTFDLLTAKFNQSIIVPDCTEPEIWGNSPKQFLKYRVHKLSGHTQPMHGQTDGSKALCIQHLTVAEAKNTAKNNDTSCTTANNSAANIKTGECKLKCDSKQSEIHQQVKCN